MAMALRLSYLAEAISELMPKFEGISDSLIQDDDVPLLNGIAEQISHSGKPCLFFVTRRRTPHLSFPRLAACSQSIQTGHYRRGCAICVSLGELLSTRKNKRGSFKSTPIPSRTATIPPQSAGLCIVGHLFAADLCC